MPLFSSAMPFFPAPCPFSESTFCALHFGKRFVKIGQKIRKLRDFFLKSAETNLLKCMILTSTVVDCFNPLFINCTGKINIDNKAMTIPNMTPNELLIRKGVKLECPTW